MPSGYCGADRSMRHTEVKALTAVNSAATMSSIMLDFVILPEKLNFMFLQI